MLRIHKFAAIPVLSLALIGSQGVFAQDHHDDHDNSHYVHHEEWRKGYHMRQEDWGRGDHIDNWKQYHLHHPPNGYEWRRIDGNFVLADNNGVVTEVVVAK
jgi:Ni/Co efflux regulator RcnB